MPDFTIRNQIETPMLSRGYFPGVRQGFDPVGARVAKVGILCIVALCIALPFEAEGKVYENVASDTRQGPPWESVHATPARTAAEASATNTGNNPGNIHGSGWGGPQWYSAPSSTSSKKFANTGDNPGNRNASGWGGS